MALCPFCDWFNAKQTCMPRDRYVFEGNKNCTILKYKMQASRNKPIYTINLPRLLFTSGEDEKGILINKE